MNTGQPRTGRRLPVAQAEHIPVVPSLHTRSRPVSPLVMAYGFAGMIMVGTLLLFLPFATQNGQSPGLLQALFTATSAVTVTGLTVVDTASYWSPFGQWVILGLIQLGGLGFMTSSTLLLLILGRRVTLRERLLIREAMGRNPTAGGMVRLVRRIILLTVVIEAAGAIYLAWRFSSYYPLGTSLWNGFFHSVSAFNNAGFSILQGQQSFREFQTDAAMLLGVAALVILGGISYTLLVDVARFRRFHRLTVDSRIVLVATGVLLAGGTALLLLTEASNPQTLGPLSWPFKLVNAFFHAVVPRTAGFSSLPISGVAEVSLFFIMVMMFIGAASGSTGGGIKLNTVGILVAMVWSTLRGRPHAEAFGRELMEEQLHRAMLLVALGLAVVLTAALGLSLLYSRPFTDLLFESFSAFSTVGLSRGVTQALPPLGQLIIIVTMFVGRLGPLTLALSLTQAQQQRRLYRYAQEAVKIG